MGHLYQSYVKFSGGHLVTPKEILPAERNEVHLSCESSWSKACGCNWFKTLERKKTEENEGIPLSRGPHCDEAFAMSYPWLWSHAEGYGVGWWLHPWVAVVDPWMNFPSFPRIGRALATKPSFELWGLHGSGGSTMNLAEIHGKS